VLSPRWQGASRFHDRRVLRGGSGEDELHELLWDASFTSVLEVAAGTGAAASDAPQVIGVDLACGEHLVRVDAARPRVEIGRDPASDLHVPTAGASRLHAIVEWNRGRVQVGDVSTNGTTLERAGHGVKRLHHESATLEGEGKLWLGGGPSGDVRPVIYRCVTG